MRGIDISEHNGNIDFKKVKQDNIDFVIIRIGWIGNFNNHKIDLKFEQYYSLAKQAGLKIGFYVYSYIKDNSKIQGACEWCYNLIKNKSHEFPIFLDLEDASIINLTKEQLTEQCIVFNNYFKNRNINAGCYASKSWFVNKINTDTLIWNNMKIWLAEWREGSYTANFHVDLWQYSSNGDIKGINGRVDLNRCLNCENNNTEQITGKKEGFEMKVYQNGSTKEIVFQDIYCVKQIGYLNPYETASCYGIVDNKAIIVYNVDGSNNLKVGFCKWLRWNKGIICIIKGR